MSSSDLQPRRDLTLTHATALVVGIIIGTGVFLKTASMAQAVGTPTLVLAAWVVAGVVAMLGALCFAELGALLPHAGGEYVYLRTAYGEIPGFLFACNAFVLGGAAVAAYGAAVAIFISDIHPLGHEWLTREVHLLGVAFTFSFGARQLLAIGVIAVFAAINCAGVMLGGRVQSILTAAKAVAILGVALGVFLFGGTANLPFDVGVPDDDESPGLQIRPGWGGAGDRDLDDDLWRAMVTTSQGVDVLLAPEMLVEGVNEVRDAAPILEFARSRYDIIVIDMEGRAVGTTARPSAETLLHTQLYRRFTEVNAVLHTHSRTQTVASRLFAPAGVIRIEGYELIKAIAGHTTHATHIDLPIFANTQDMPELVERVDVWIRTDKPLYGYLIDGHGIYTWGRDMTEAERHIEAFEFLLGCELDLRRSQT